VLRLGAAAGRRDERLEPWSERTPRQRSPLAAAKISNVLGDVFVQFPGSFFVATGNQRCVDKFADAPKIGCQLASIGQEVEVAFRKLLAITVAAAVIGAFSLAAAPARADNIILNQWYTGTFGFDGSAALSGGNSFAVPDTDGPLLGGGFAGAILAPDAPWIITLPSPGTLTIADDGISGDQFQMFDQMATMNAAASPFTAAGQNPGQTSPGNGLTSTPCFACSGPDTSDINVALGEASFSSATFALAAGINVITGIAALRPFSGVGTFDFIAEVTPTQVTPSPVPLPSALPLFATALGGLGLLGWRRKKKAQAA
jgi:hypothetical protein